MERRAAADGIHAESFAASLLHEPWTVRTGQGGPYRVFTPFWKAVSGRPVRSAWGTPDAGRGAALSLPADGTAEDGTAEWGLLPDRPDWTGGLREASKPGAAAGERLLEDFASGPVRDYAEDRDRPDVDGTSRLSPTCAGGTCPRSRSATGCWRPTAGRAARSSPPNWDGASSAGTSSTSTRNWPSPTCAPNSTRFPGPGRRTAPTRRPWPRPGGTDAPASNWSMRASGNCGPPVDAQPG